MNDCDFGFYFKMYTEFIGLSCFLLDPNNNLEKEFKKIHDLTTPKITGDKYFSVRGFNKSPTVRKSIEKHRMVQRGGDGFSLGCLLNQKRSSSCPLEPRRFQPVGRKVV